ncbi:MAG: hypothetical protein K6G31_12185 [Paludibacteraceae bacterium]|nr:hypothetical protein [Paludibacteraceae bacterium]
MKKLFRLTALATMVSLVATISVTTSCSDDDDDENDNKNNPAVVDTTKNDTVVPPEQTDTVPVVNQEEVFVLEVGGSKSKASSFFSIQNKKTYKVAELDKNSGVEIVYDGKKFFGAQSSVNDFVASTGLNATITVVEQNKEFLYTTNGADFGGKSYSGSIKVTKGEMGDESATVTITVTRKILAES